MLKILIILFVSVSCVQYLWSTILVLRYEAQVNALRE